MKCGLDEDAVRWIESWVNGQVQRVVVSGTNSIWRPTISGVPPRSIVGPIGFDIFINDRNVKAE